MEQELNKQIPSNPEKNTRKLEKQQAIHKNPQENGERKEPQEKKSSTNSTSYFERGQFH
jgi:hypothetical protein